MPTDDLGIYRATKPSKILKRRQLVKVPNKGIISNWPTAKKANFERELIARKKTIDQIADEYGVCYNTAANWKRRILQPAIRAAEQQTDIDECKKARQYLNWLYEEATDSIKQMKYGKPVLGPDGEPLIDPETGREKREMGDPKVHGTVAQLLGQGKGLAEKIGEVTGEFHSGERNATPTIIKVITIPKIGENVPQFAISVGKQLPPAVDVLAEEVGVDA